MSNDLSRPFSPDDRSRIRTVVSTVEHWVDKDSKKAWLMVQAKMWAKWAGGAFGVVAAAIHYWPTILDVVAVILKAPK